MGNAAIGLKTGQLGGLRTAKSLLTVGLCACIFTSLCLQRCPCPKVVVQALVAGRTVQAFGERNAFAVALVAATLG